MNYNFTDFLHEVTANMVEGQRYGQAIMNAYRAMVLSKSRRMGDPRWPSDLPDIWELYYHDSRTQEWLDRAQLFLGG